MHAIKHFIIQTLLFAVLLCTVLFAVFAIIDPRVAEAPVPVYEQIANGDALPSGALALTMPAVTAEQLENIPSNRLRIPKIGVDAPMWEGGEEQLAKGVWHLPGTGNPQGHMVLSSHRWKYPSADPRSFYDLNELFLGDSIVIVWEGEEYEYKVAEVFEVNPDAVAILDQDLENTLTLFTCTPLFSTEKRLVVRAERIFE